MSRRFCITLTCIFYGVFCFLLGVQITPTIIDISPKNPYIEKKLYGEVFKIEYIGSMGNMESYGITLGGGNMCVLNKFVGTK